MSSQYKPKKQTNIHFTKVPTSSGKLKTKVRFVRTTVTSERQRGLLHKAYNLKSRVTGDVPSVNKKLNSFKPKTKQGKVALSVVKGSYNFSKGTVKTVFKTGMAVESASLFLSDRISPYKQLQFNFTREQTSNGKFKTKVNVVSDGTDFKRQRGILHKLYHTSNRFKGDVPSLTKKLNSFQPKTKKGKVGISAAKASYKFIKTSGKAVANTALGVENVALFTKDKAIGKYKQKLKAEMSNHDTAKGLLKVYGAGKGLVTHVKEKKAYSFEKKRLKYRKSETKLIDVEIKFDGPFQKKPLATVFRKNGNEMSFGFKILRPFTFQIRKADNERNRLKANFKKRKAEFTADKKEFKSQKNTYKSSNKSNSSKATFKHQKAEFKAKKKDFKKYEKTFKKLDSANVKRFKNQKQLTKLTKPKSVASKVAGNVANSYTNKLKEADSNNDFLALANKSAEIAKVTKGTVKAAKTNVARFRENKYEKNINKQQDRLKQQEKRLKDKKTTKNKPNKKRKKVVETVTQEIKNFIRTSLIVVKAVVSDFGSKFLLALIPFVLLFVVGISLISTFITGFFSESGWVMGTYTADDEQLASAVQSYTLHARNLNEAVVQCGTTNDWKKGLRQAAGSSYNAEINSYTDTPSTGNFYYGKSSELNYEPAEYDFDPYILWSFLTAYYYDFDKAEECRNNGEIYSPEYWEVTDVTEDLLKELFDLEYSFEFSYRNDSRWIDIYPCELRPIPIVEDDGGISYSYYSIHCDTIAQNYDSNGNYSYSEFKYRNLPSELRKYTKNGYIHFDENTLEILNANNDNKQTGWYLQDQTISIWGKFSDGSEGWRSSFYYTDEYGDLCWGSSGNPRTSFFWGEIGKPSYQDILWCVSPNDTNSWNSSLNDLCLVSYYQKSEYKKQASLYYNVKRNCTFKEAAVQMLSNASHPNESLEYFAVLVGDDDHNYKGNHQCLKSPVSESMAELIANNRIYNGYGYDVDEWNSNHCNIKYDHHNGLDITCGVSEQIYAMIDGEVTDIDGDKITISAKDKELIYSKGTSSKEKYDITISYENVSPTVSIGDNVGAGDLIGHATDTKKCVNYNNTTYGINYVHIQIRIQSAGFLSIVGQDFYADPRLLIY